MKITGIILLLIGILSLIGGLASPSGADPGVVIIGYFLKFAFIIGGITLIVKGQRSPNYKINKSNKNAPQRSTSYENTENKKPDEYSSIQEKKEALSDLATDNVITKNEYYEKLALLNEQEQDIIEQQNKKQIDSLVEKQIESSVSKLDELLKANILSKDEFETKKKQLYKKHYEKIVHSIPHLSLNNSHQKVRSLAFCYLMPNELFFDQQTTI